MRIAVIGSGVAGLSCAHILGPHHDVVLYEADDRLGGHANTVDVDDADGQVIAVDTGFIVHNDRNYPHLVRLFDELDVPVQNTEMSFGVIDRDPNSPTEGFAYRATNLNTLFADRRRLIDPAMWRMLRDIARFYRHASTFLDHPDPSISTSEFLERGGYSREFLELHLIPMGAAVWSADPTTFAEFPAQSLLTFLRNHGLLGVGRRPQWRTVVGGSRVYVQAIADRFGGEIRLSSPVEAVRRIGGPGSDRKVEVRSGGSRGTVEVFDRVVLAAHSDQSLRMLTDASSAEREVLGAVRYQPNRATLHHDLSLLPATPAAQAAWNYERRGPALDRATLTYDMTALQHLPGSRRHLVSLNSDDAIDPARVLATFEYAHPVFDRAAINAQGRFEEIDGVNGVHFCGAWWSYGFHEDGIASAVRVCERIGVHW